MPPTPLHLPAVHPFADRLDADPVLRLMPYSFERAFTRRPDGMWSAPYVLRLAGVPGRAGIVTTSGWRLVVAAAPRDDGILRLASLNRPHESVTMLAGTRSPLTPRWAGPAQDVVAHLVAATSQAGTDAARGGLASGVLPPTPAISSGHPSSPAALPGLDLLAHGDLPEAAGLDPAVPLACATALAWTTFHGTPLPARVLDTLLRGTTTHTPDASALRSACLLGIADQALVLGADAPAGYVPFPLDADGVRLMLIVPRSPAGPRRPPAPGRTERAMAAETRRAARLQTLLRRGELAAGARLMTASHDARSPGYGAGTAEGDDAVRAALAAGALGARAAGGATAGAGVVALVPVTELASVRTGVSRAFRRLGRPVPRFLSAGSGGRCEEVASL